MKLSRKVVVFGGLCLLFLVGRHSVASIPVQQAASEKTNHYIETGVVVGGYDQGPVTLANVRHSYSLKDKMERVVLDLEGAGGDGKNRLQRPGFFHFALQKN